MTSCYNATFFGHFSCVPMTNDVASHQKVPRQERPLQLCSTFKAKVSERKVRVLHTILTSSFTMSFLTRATRKAPLFTFVRAQSRALSSSQNAAETDNPRFYPVYVHHLSKVCLEHMQNTRADWLEQEGLSRGLSINSDGTFVLNFPRTNDNVDNGRIW